MRIPVLQGREFTAADRDGQPRVVVINAALAGRYWPNGSPLGSIVRLGASDIPHTVVGVVGDSRQVSLSEDQRDQVFVAQAQDPWAYLRVLARTVGDPTAFGEEVASAIHDVDPLLPVVETRTMSDVVEQALLPQRALSLSLVAMGGFALGLALLGIYGIVMVYVVDRTRELGIRVALGADQARIVRYVLVRGLRLAVVGAGVGLALSVVASLALRGMLYGVGAGDPLTYLLVVVLVVGVAAVAGLLPARRAARISPTLAMKSN